MNNVHLAIKHGSATLPCGIYRSVLVGRHHNTRYPLTKGQVDIQCSEKPSPCQQILYIRIHIPLSLKKITVEVN
jgi:hypothetical protein